MEEKDAVTRKIGEHQARLLHQGVEISYWIGPNPPGRRQIVVSLNGRDAGRSDIEEGEDAEAEMSSATLRALENAIRGQGQ